MKKFQKNMERSKSKNGAEKLDSFVIFRRNSFGYIKGNKTSKKSFLPDKETIVECFNNIEFRI